jgi:ABC-type nitrate/sulfonate/bicarbonate transport system substrate-binding protein
MAKLISVDSSRREVLRATSGLGGMAALQGFGAVVGMGVTPAMAAAMQVSSLRSTSRSWLWGAEDFAIDAKHFERSGLKVAMAATERGVNHDALIGGAADILLGAPQQNMRVQILGKPVVIFAGMVNKFASNIVVKKSILDKLGVSEKSSVQQRGAALKGLRLGHTGPGGAPDQLLRHFLKAGGVDPNKDAKLVPIRGGVAMIAAMEKDQIDGFCLSSPTSDQAIKRAGAAYLFNMAINPPPGFEDFLYITASVTEDTLKKKEAQLVAYAKGIALALKAIHEDQNAFKAMARVWFKAVDDAMFEIAFRNNIGIYMKTPVPTQHHFDVNLKFMNASLIDSGQKPAPADYSYQKAFNSSIVKKALG